MNKIRKIFIMFIIIIEIFIVSSNYIYADFVDGLEQNGETINNSSSQEKTESQGSFSGDIFSQADNFIRNGKDETQEKAAIDEKKLKDAFSNIFNIAVSIGTVLTVIIGGILGIKFMIASAEDKAKIKEMMIPYVVGCIVIFGAFTIWKFIVNILNQI